MKALGFSKFGPPSVLAVEEIAKPEPHKGEVLVQIKATAINPSDVKNVAGAFKSSLAYQVVAKGAAQTKQVLVPVPPV